MSGLATKHRNRNKHGGRTTRKEKFKSLNEGWPKRMTENALVSVMPSSLFPWRFSGQRVWIGGRALCFYSLSSY